MQRQSHLLLIFFLSVFTLNAQSDCLFCQNFGSDPEIDSTPSFWEDPEGLTYNQYEIITPDKVGLWKYYRVSQETGSKEIISERYIYCLNHLEPRSAESTDQKIKLYPNPVSSELNVQHNIPNCTIEIRNVNGGLLKHFNKGQMNFTIDVEVDNKACKITLWRFQKPSQTLVSLI